MGSLCNDFYYQGSQQHFDKKMQDYCTGQKMDHYRIFPINTGMYRTKNPITVWDHVLVDAGFKYTMVGESFEVCWPQMDLNCPPWLKKVLKYAGWPQIVIRKPLILSIIAKQIR